MEEKKTYRVFDTGATRDSDSGKLEYSRYINPLADYSFAEYMKSKQIIGGEYRRGDNWQKGIPAESLFDSLIRHMEIVKLLRKGHTVTEITKDGVIDLLVDKSDISKNDYDKIDFKDIISELNAIRFNSEALKLHILQLQNDAYNEDVLPDYDH